MQQLMSDTLNMLELTTCARIITNVYLENNRGVDINLPDESKFISCC